MFNLFPFLHKRGSWDDVADMDELCSRERTTCFGTHDLVNVKRLQAYAFREGGRRDGVEGEAKKQARRVE